jgi:hypothetical protein
MPSEVTARVRKYRERCAQVWVEVEFSTIEDASIVRQFAQQRRDAARWPADSKVIRVQH